ncbi:MAG: sulfite exporter TauE/SafE family protein [Anaerohalosphaera sp.]|nr:sulfite exporter TauE/SafE family protein [Anaerohalosphaera sp.]
MFDFDLSSFDLDVWKWCLLLLCAFLVGISKTGIPGFGILSVPLMAIVMADKTKQSVGLLLPLLIFADIFAVIYHRRNAHWIHIIKLLPWALAGVVTGYFAMDKVSDSQLKPIIGGTVLAMLVIRYWSSTRQIKEGKTSIPTHWAFAATMGFIAGVTTMMANAAGPIMIIYLLAMKLPKVEFVGTAAWYFFIVNWVKVPFQIELGYINPKSFALNLYLFPAIVLGAVAGIFLLNKIPQKYFNPVMQVLAVAAAIKLLLM